MRRFLSLCGKSAKASSEGRSARARLSLEALEDRTVPSTLAAEFQGYGVWRYEESTGWRQLTAANATLVAAGSHGEVAAEFQGYGVWRYEDNTGWQHLTNSDASILDMRTNGNVAAEFQGSGVWRYEDKTGWQHLTGANASLLNIDRNGDLVGEFQGSGVWRFEDSTGWVQLTKANASSLDIADNANVVGEFQGSGVWRFQDGTGWSHLTAADAAYVHINEVGNVMGDFKGYGVWRYEDATGWKELNNADASLGGIAAAASDSEVAGAFSSGVWLYDTTGWHQLTSAVPTAMAIDRTESSSATGLVETDYANGKAVEQETRDSAGNLIKDVTWAASGTVETDYAGGKASEQKTWDSAGVFTKDVTWAASGTVETDYAGGKAAEQKTWNAAGVFLKDVTWGSAGTVETDYAGGKAAEQKTWDSAGIFTKDVTWAASGTVETDYAGGKAAEQKTWDSAGNFTKDVTWTASATVETDYAGGKVVGAEVWDAAGHQEYSVLAPDGSIWFLGTATVSGAGDHAIYRLTNGQLNSVSVTSARIGTKWLGMGGPSSTLGFPTGDVNQGNGFTWQNFQNGVIYSSDATGAHGLLGNPNDPTTFWGKFAQLDYERGLGLPTSDVNQGNGFTWQNFQNGVIYWSGATGAHAIFGNPNDPSTFWGKFAQLDYERGLGLPTSDVNQGNGFTWQNFQNGVIYWSGATGAHAIFGNPNDPTTFWGQWAQLGFEHSRLGLPVSEATATAGELVQNFQYGAIVENQATGTFSLELWAYDGYSEADVMQEQSGTCVFLSSLAGAAKEGFDFQNHIRYVGNNNYVVQLFLPGSGWVPEPVFYNGQAMTEGKTLLDPKYFTDDYWPILYQRAYLEYIGLTNPAQVAAFQGEVDSKRALTAITGLTTEVGAPAAPGSDGGIFFLAGSPSTSQPGLVGTPQNLQRDLQLGDIVTAGDGAKVTLPNVLLPKHSYTVEQVYQMDNQWFVVLRNPWGLDLQDSNGNPIVAPAPYKQAGDRTSDGYIQLNWTDFVANFDVYTRTDVVQSA
jgi:hypothetical protein